MYLCKICGRSFDATQPATTCGNRCRSTLRRDRARALRDDLAAFRLATSDLLARLAQSADNPDALGDLAAEAAALTPDSLRAR